MGLRISEIVIKSMISFDNNLKDKNDLLKSIEVELLVVI